MRYALSLLFILFLTVTSIAQTFEGTVNYAIEYDELPAEMQGFEAMLPSTMVMMFRGDQVRMEQTVMGGQQVAVTNSKDNSGFVLMDMMGQKIAFQLEPTLDDVDADVAYTYENEKQKIAGYNCKKAIADLGEGNTAVIYYTKDIKGTHSEYKGLDGFPLKYEASNDGIKFMVTATEVVSKKLEDNLFSIPEGYQVMSQDELMNMFGGE